MQLEQNLKPNLTSIPIVILIESPNPRDVLDKRSEGESLFAALELANIKVLRFRVYDIQNLRECFNRIAYDIRPYTRILPDKEPVQNVFEPHLHFSAHGNEDGIGLTSGEFLTWEMLRELLIEFAKPTMFFGKLPNKDIHIGWFPVAFSTCKNMFANKSEHPCIAVIGPETTVLWEDSLTAFIVFYHLAIAKNMMPKDCMDLMNSAAGLKDVFQCRTFQCDENNTK